MSYDEVCRDPACTCDCKICRRARTERRALRAYRNLETALNLEMPEPVDDLIREAMDELWLLLTPEERESAKLLHRCPKCNYSRPFTEWPADEPCASCSP